MFALSTTWNAYRHTSGIEMVREIKGLGFDEIELGFTLASEMVDEVVHLSRKGEIHVVSIHNYCPIPRGFTRERASPDCYALSSQDETQRILALRNTKRTIDLAHELKAHVVILHLGAVPTTKNTKTLIKLYKQGRFLTDKYKNFLNELIEEREKNKQRTFASVLSSLKELGKYAEFFNISLGVENRYYFHEIPSLEEIGVILQECADFNVYYWHDVGHAQVSQNLGKEKHLDYLKNYALKMIGIHLHDVQGADDHKAPLKGNFKFEILKPFLSKKTLKVLEPHYPATAEQIQKGVKYLKELFGE
jgi:sugar phosphate isomerase/epimerase